MFKVLFKISKEIYLKKDSAQFGFIAHTLCAFPFKLAGSTLPIITAFKPDLPGFPFSHAAADGPKDGHTGKHVTYGCPRVI